MKLLFLSVAVLAWFAPLSVAGEIVSTSGASKVALSGFDPVAFFTDSKPVNGSPTISAEHLGVTYFFASEEHKQLFAATPAKYLPQFGGYCAFGVSVDSLLPVDVSTWLVKDGKLFLSLNKEIRQKLDGDVVAVLAEANTNWPGLVKRFESATKTPASVPVLINVAGASKVALGGLDPVAFFTDKMPVSGTPSITAEHQGATYFFASEEHKKLFSAKPEMYVPQFGGYCAFGVSVGKLFPVDLSTGQVHNGRLYFNLNADVLKGFKEDLAGNIAKAEKNWPGLVKVNG